MHSPTIPEATLHYAVVRSYHSPRCLVPLPHGTCFQRVEAIATPKKRSRVAKPTNMLHDRCSRGCTECSHYACGLKSGRLTPCIHNTLMSGKKSRWIRETSAVLATLVSTAKDSPRTRSGREQGMSSDSPRTRHGHGQGADTDCCAPSALFPRGQGMENHLNRGKQMCALDCSSAPHNSLTNRITASSTFLEACSRSAHSYSTAIDILYSSAILAIWIRTMPSCLRP
jgi:hypothetical protein